MKIFSKSTKTLLKLVLIPLGIIAIISIYYLARGVKNESQEITLNSPSSVPNFTLLKTDDITEKLSPNMDGVGRPDVVAIGDELYLAYGILTERNHHLVQMKSDLDLTLINNTPLELFSGTHDFSVDIRLSEANDKLWYAFEDNKFKGTIGDDHYLNAAWYSESNELIGRQIDIATGVSTGLPEAFSINPDEVPENPEAGDDPTPLWHNNSYYIFTRAWSGWIDEFTPNSKHHIRVFNEDYQKIDDFILDLSEIMPGKTLSQNALIDIEGRIHLIGGFYNKRDDVKGGSAVYAIPLSDDLKTTSGGKIPLLTDSDKWFSKVTSARVHKGYLYINYQQYISGKDTQNIAVFDIQNNYKLIKTLELSSTDLEGVAITANHTSFEIMDDKLFAFYPETNQRIFVKIFDLSGSGDNQGETYTEEEIQSSNIPYYFIAIHNEALPDPLYPEVTLETSYITLKEITTKANNYNIKLTLMFNPQWVDYINSDFNRLEDLKKWKLNGHEIAAHHHAIKHPNWNGYTNMPEDEAITLREKLRKDNVSEEYLGTMDDYVNKLQEINPFINAGCVGKFIDMPDNFIYDTCSGVGNAGDPGQKLLDGDPKKGINEYISSFMINGIERKYLAHAQITTAKSLSEAKGIVDSMESMEVYGASGT